MNTTREIELSEEQMEIYVKPNSNCGGLELTTLNAILGGEWEDEDCWRGMPIVRTGEDLTPRRVVGWSSVFGGTATDLRAYRRIDHIPALAFVGADWGLRILANDNEEGEQDPDAAHLPAGWGQPLMIVYDLDDLVNADLRQCWPSET